MICPGCGKEHQTFAPIATTASTYTKPQATYTCPDGHQWRGRLLPPDPEPIPLPTAHSTTPELALLDALQEARAGRCGPLVIFWLPPDQVEPEEPTEEGEEAAPVEDLPPGMVWSDMAIGDASLLHDLMGDALSALRRHEYGSPSAEEDENGPG